MPTIPTEGDQFEFYSSATGLDIGIFPAGLVAQVPDALPVRLQRGDRLWGGLHIATKHGHWLDKQRLDVHEMVWLKLRQQGSVYTTEIEGKLKISLKIHPSALLVLRLIETANESFMTVVSVYFHPNSLDGTFLSSYQPFESLPAGGAALTIPHYALPVHLPPPPTVVTYKKKRTIAPPVVDADRGTPRKED